MTPAAPRRVLLPILAVLLATMVAWPAAAQTPVTPARTFVPSDKGLSHEVFAFFLPSSRDQLLREADWSVLSTVAYFGIVARPGGTLAKRTGGRTDADWAAWDSPLMDRIIASAHRVDTNVVLTVTRFAWTEQGQVASRKLLASAAARARLASAIAAEVRRRGIDGINLDFEPIPNGQTANYVKLVRAVRSELDKVRPGLDLTVASTGYIANYDVAGLTAPGAANAIFIMAYHYNGAWSSHAGAVSPLRRHTYDVTDTVNAYLALTKPSKIMLGVPYYGYIWSTVTGDAHAATRPPSSRWGYPTSVLYDTAAALADRYGRRWDPVERGPWVRWRARACAGCPVTWRQLYYEDPQSLGLKYDLVKAKGLRGTGMWTLGYQGDRTELEDALRQAFLAR